MQLCGGRARLDARHYCALKATPTTRDADENRCDAGHVHVQGRESERTEIKNRNFIDRESLPSIQQIGVLLLLSSSLSFLTPPAEHTVLDVPHAPFTPTFFVFGLTFAPYIQTWSDLLGLIGHLS